MVGHPVGERRLRTRRSRSPAAPAAAHALKPATVRARLWLPARPACRPARFTSFTLQLATPDGDQTLTGLSVHLPAGDRRAASKRSRPAPNPKPPQGTCGPESEIGQATASSRPGPDPVHRHRRTRLHHRPIRGRAVRPVDRHPRGRRPVQPRQRGRALEDQRRPAAPPRSRSPAPLPTSCKASAGPRPASRSISDDVNVTVNRPDFEYNPTSCNPMQHHRHPHRRRRARQPTSPRPSRSQAARTCRFKPGVTATTQGKTSKADGASLRPDRSNPGRAKRTSPRRSCTIPATCPRGSRRSRKRASPRRSKPTPPPVPKARIIGTADVHTPVLKNPLTGPIYLVSHGNAAWPDAELVLQGEGITLILDGQTAIKKGVTTSSFLIGPRRAV